MTIKPYADEPCPLKAPRCGAPHPDLPGCCACDLVPAHEGMHEGETFHNDALLGMQPGRVSWPVNPSERRCGEPYKTGNPCHRLPQHEGDHECSVAITSSNVILVRWRREDGYVPRRQVDALIAGLDGCLFCPAPRPPATQQAALRYRSAGQSGRVVLCDPCARTHGHRLVDLADLPYAVALRVLLASTERGR